MEEAMGAVAVSSVQQTSFSTLTNELLCIIIRRSGRVLLLCACSKHMGSILRMCCSTSNPLFVRLRVHARHVCGHMSDQEIPNLSEVEKGALSNVVSLFKRFQYAVAIVVCAFILCLSSHDLLPFINIG